MGDPSRSLATRRFAWRASCTRCSGCRATSHAAGSTASRALAARFPTAIEPRTRVDPPGHEDHQAKRASQLAKREGG
eukprot:scaffold1557_cov108-Isochrysis_galbana.AAC.14